MVQSAVLSALLIKFLQKEIIYLNKLHFVITQYCLNRLHSVITQYCLNRLLSVITQYSLNKLLSVITQYTRVLKVYMYNFILIVFIFIMYYIDRYTGLPHRVL
jgi:hypothetical protein